MKTFVFSFAIFLSTLGITYAQQSNPMVGAWELIEGTYQSADNLIVERKQPEKPFQLKVFSPGHFSYVMNNEDDSFGGASAGTYRIEGNQYIETHYWHSAGNNGTAIWEFLIEDDMLYMKSVRFLDSDGKEMMQNVRMSEVRRKVK